jgi:hypothetical protein
MPLFEVAILEKPTKKEAEEGKGEVLVFGPTAVVANDAQSAVAAPFVDAANPVIVDHYRMVVLVRNFLGTNQTCITTTSPNWQELTKAIPQ